MLLNPKDISFVVQGAIDSATIKRCLSSIRAHFGSAPEIIVSTWPNQCLDHVYDHDILLENNDPGPNNSPHAHQNNLARQITSSRYGCLRASRRYVFKIRSDIEFVNTNILQWHTVFNQRSERYKLFSERISVSNIYTIKHDQSPAFLCDFVYFGRRHDLIKLFTVDPFPRTSLGPEQYLTWAPFMRKYGLSDTIPSNLAEHIVGNNYQVLDGQRQMGCYSLKYPRWLDNWNENTMTHMEWINMYYNAIYNRIQGII